MPNPFFYYTVIAVFAPLIGSIIAGIGCYKLSKTAAHIVTIAGVAIAFLASAALFNGIVINGAPQVSYHLYTWGVSGAFTFNINFLLDKLTVIMMLTVTLISLIVHIYSIGYMEEDPSNQRFFSYMSLFTFMMLMLVTANNFFQLFFGWEGVGLVSYLLIGFWFNKESAAQGSLKAFIVNRIGDFGFLLGIAGVMDYFGTLNYQAVFAKAPDLANTTITLFPGHSWSVLTVICVLLFVGAVGKSAQIPLHVWLPESMEGPTPISALIHAATMVTAGVFMVARLSPLFELSEVALGLVLVVGSLTALLTGLIGVVQMDIKRVIAYSTMSQLGYMMAANGASAYSAAIFHLVNHAFFKSLLFLGAGSVIVALHHQQDMRYMGNLKKYMPITYVTFLMGALSLAAIPPFAGFYSKDPIIEAAFLSDLPGSLFAYICLLLATFVTALYIFRAFFMTFHGKENLSTKQRSHVQESPTSMTVPLVILAIPSLILGWILAKPMLYGADTYLDNAVMVKSGHDVLQTMAHHFPGKWLAIIDAFISLPFWFAVAGVVAAWLGYVRYPYLPGWISEQLSWLYRSCQYKLGFDWFYDLVFVRGGRGLAWFLFRIADVALLDQLIVLGSGRTIVRISQLSKRLQSGYLYHYAFAMILGLFVFLCWLVLFRG